MKRVRLYSGNVPSLERYCRIGQVSEGDCFFGIYVDTQKSNELFIPLKAILENKKASKANFFLVVHKKENRMVRSEHCGIMEKVFPGIAAKICNFVLSAQSKDGVP
jgi:hypothetical protein